MNINPYIVLGSSVVGFLVGLTGAGGGALMTPMLILIFGITPSAAITSDLVAAVLMRPVGAIVHLRKGTVNLRLVGWMVLGSVPFAFLGSYLLLQFVFLILQNAFLVSNIFSRLFKMLNLFSNLFIGVFDMFFSKLHFKLLHFDFFIDRFKFTAVFHIFALLLVLLNKRLRVFDGILLLINEFLDAINFFFNTGLPRVKTLDLIFQVSHFHRQLTL